MALPVFVTKFVFVAIAVFVSLCVYVFVSVLLTQMVENIDAGCHHWLSLASAASSGVGGKLKQQQRPGGESLFWLLRHPPRSQRMVAASILRLFASALHCSTPPTSTYAPSLSPPPPNRHLRPRKCVADSPPVQPEPELAPPPTEYRIFGRVNRDKSRRTAGRWQVRLGGRQVHQLHLERWSLAECTVQCPWIQKSSVTIVKHAPVSIELIQMHLDLWSVADCTVR